MFGRFKYMIEKNFDLKRSFDMNKDITKEELNSYIKQGTIVIDVRSPQEYREGHLKNAILIPEYEIIKRCNNELPEKDQLIVLYCEAGMRSRKARRKLRRMGYTNVYNIYDVTMQDFKK